MQKEEDKAPLIQPEQSISPSNSFKNKPSSKRSSTQQFLWPPISDPIWMWAPYLWMALILQSIR